MDPTQTKQVLVEPIAIIGVGGVFPDARSIQDYWANIISGLDSIREIPKTHWKIENYYSENKKDIDKVYAKTGAFLNPTPFDPMSFGLNPQNMQTTDTTQLFALLLARETLRDAGYWREDKACSPHRTSVILGVTGTLQLSIPLGARLHAPHWISAMKAAGIDEKKSREAVKNLQNHYVPWQESSFPGLLGNVTAGRVANQLNLHGTNCVVDAACASTLAAVHLSCLELRAGHSDLILTGGVDTFNDVFMYSCFSHTHALSSTDHARPFSKSADGTILGEGAGMVALKRLSDAEKDQNHIYGVIKSIGTSSDGRGTAIYTPMISGQKEAVRQAYRLAGVQARDISLIESHGTGTRVGDQVELSALLGVFSERQERVSWCALGSVKAQIGHTKAAAGIASFLKVLMAIKHKVLPRSLKSENPLSELQNSTCPLYLNQFNRPWVSFDGKKRVAAISAFGFGGSNYHCVIEEYTKEKKDVGWSFQFEILPFYAESRQKLIEDIKHSLYGLSHWSEILDLGKTLRSVQKNNAECMVFVLNKSCFSDQLKEIFAYFSQFFTLKKPKCIFDSSRKEHYEVVAYLSSAKSVRPYALVGVVQLIPRAFEILTAAECFWHKVCPAEYKNVRLVDLWYPLRFFDKKTKNQATEHLKHTQIINFINGVSHLVSLVVLENFSVFFHDFIGDYKQLLDWRRTKRGDDSFFQSLWGQEKKFLTDSLALHEKLKNKHKIIAILGAYEKPNLRYDGIGKQQILAMDQEASDHLEGGLAHMLASFVSHGMRCNLTLWNQSWKPQEKKPTKEYQVMISGANIYEMKKNLEKESFQSTITPLKRSSEDRAADRIGIYPNIESHDMKNQFEKIQMQIDQLQKLQERSIAVHEKFIDQQRVAQASFVELLQKQQQFAERTSDSIIGASAETVDRKIKKPQVVEEGPIQNSIKIEPQVYTQSQLQKIAMEVIAEKTGYPIEELHTDMNLENDLGIDSIKRVEIMALIQEQIVLPDYLDQEKLSSLPTIISIIKYLEHVLGVGSREVSKYKQKEVQAKSTADSSNIEILSKVKDILSEKTGYPQNLLEASMNLENDLGIDSIKRVEVFSELQQKFPVLESVDLEKLGELATIGDIVRFLETDVYDSASREKKNSHPS